MEQTNIIIHVTNGIRTENLGVRVAEDRPLDHEIDTSTVSKTLCAHIKKNRSSGSTNSSLTLIVDEIHGPTEERSSNWEQTRTRRAFELARGGGVFSAGGKAARV